MAGIGVQLCRSTLSQTFTSGQTVPMDTRHIERLAPGFLERTYFLEVFIREDNNAREPDVLLLSRGQVYEFAGVSVDHSMAIYSQGDNQHLESEGLR